MVERSPSLYEYRHTIAVNHRPHRFRGRHLFGGASGWSSRLLALRALCGLPFAFIVAELCSAFPKDGGFTVWVLNAYGPFWAFQVGYWSWVAGVLRGALMPGTLLNLLTRYYNVEVKSSVAAYFIKAGIGIALAIPTFLGTRTVGRLSFVVVVVVILFFSVFTIWSLANASDFDDIFQVRREASCTILRRTTRSRRAT